MSTTRVVREVLQDWQLTECILSRGFLSLLEFGYCLQVTMEVPKDPNRG